MEVLVGMGWRARVAKGKDERKRVHAQYQAKKHGTYLIRPLWLQKEEDDEEDGDRETQELRGLRCHLCSVSAGEADNILNRLVGFIGNATHSRQCCAKAKTELAFACEFNTIEGLIKFGRTHVLVTGFTLWRFHRELAAHGIWNISKRTYAERLSRKRSRGAAGDATILDGPVIAANYEEEMKTLCKTRAEEFEHPTRAAMAALRRSAVGGHAIEEAAFNGRAALLPQQLPYDVDVAMLQELVYITHCQTANMERFMYGGYEGHVQRELAVESDWERNDAEMAAEGFFYSDNAAPLQHSVYIQL